MRMLDISPYYLEKMVLTMGATLKKDKSVSANILFFIVNTPLILYRNVVF